MDTKTDYHNVFNCIPTGVVLVKADAPIFTIDDMNDFHLNVLNTTREVLVGRPLFEAFPESKEEPNKIKDALYRVIKTRKTVKLEVLRYDIPDFEALGYPLVSKYWSCIYVPVFEGNDIYQIVIWALDITNLVEAGVSFPGFTKS